VNCQKDGEIEFGLFFRDGNPKIQFAASLDHVFQDLIDRVLIFAGPTGNLPSHFSTKKVQKGCGTRLA